MVRRYVKFIFNRSVATLILPFYIYLPNSKVLITNKREYYKEIGQSYPYIAIVLNGLVNGFTISLLYPLLQKFEILILTVFLLFLYYLLRGIKLIDGYTDLSEGLSVINRNTKNIDEVWKIIRTPAKGSFGILWTVLLILFQYNR